MNILVTGGAGYIGSHTCVELLNEGHQVIVVDKICNSDKEALNRVEKITAKELSFFQADIRDKSALDAIFAEQILKEQAIDAVLHFAGLKAVGESTQHPLSYYDNNVHGSQVLLSVMEKYQVATFIFSSSATVYGDPASLPIDENSPLTTTNPYGQTKLVVEQMLKELSLANDNLTAVLLRYFNPVGAHESGLIGEDPSGRPNNLMPYIAQVAVGKRSHLAVFGDDYNTPDGTGVRDYVHVVDLAKGHVKALTKLHKNTGCHVFNLGTGRGYSVLEMVTTFAQISGKPITYKIESRRSGDIAQCYAQSTLAKNTLDWSSEKNLTDMVKDTWRWQSKNPNGYASQ